MFDGVGDEQQTTPARACFISTDQRAKLSSPRRRTIGIIADLSDRVQIFADGRLRVNLAHHCVVDINEVIESGPVCCTAYVCLWHKADITTVVIYVRFRG